MLELQSYVGAGPPREAVTHPFHDGLAEAYNGLYPFSVDLLSQFHRLTEVAHPKTHEMARLVLDALPKLAAQAVPLPGVVHAAAKKQRGDALLAISDLTSDLVLTMRRDVGVSGWRERREAKKARRSSRYHQQILSPIDRAGTPPLGDHLLRLWEVRPLEGAEIPSVDDGYRVSALPRVSPDVVGNPLACAIKTATGYWRFGSLRGLPNVVEANIVRDAIRVITGNLTGYKLMHDPHVFQDDQGTRTYTWSDAARYQNPLSHNVTAQIANPGPPEP